MAILFPSSYFGQYIHLHQRRVDGIVQEPEIFIFFGFREPTNAHYFKDFQSLKTFNVVNILFLQYLKVYESISGFFIVKFLLPVMVIGNAWKWISLETSPVPVALRFTSLDVDWNGNRRPSENMIRQPLDMTYQ